MTCSPNPHHPHQPHPHHPDQVNFFEPVNRMTRQAQTNVTDEVAHLQLRPQMSDSVASLKAEMQTVSDNLATVRTVMSCASVHVIFKRAKSAVRCHLV